MRGPVEGGGGVRPALPPLLVAFPPPPTGRGAVTGWDLTPERGAWHRDSPRRTGRPEPAPLYWRGQLSASLSLHFLLCKLGQQPRRVVGIT